MSALSSTYILGVHGEILEGRRPLREQDVRMLSQCLTADAHDHLYNAVLTIHDVLRGVAGGFYSWSVVKAYYSSFYCLQAYNSFAGVFLFYKAGKPFICSAKLGSAVEPARFSKSVRGSHQLARMLFTREFGDNYFLSQEIEGLSPIEWQQNWRENINYKARRFEEPEAPKCLSYCSLIGIRKTINLYTGDDGYQYEFDPLHAMIALPLRFMRSIFLDFSVKMEEIFDDERRRFLNNALRDGGGPIHLVRMFER